MGLIAAVSADGAWWLLPAAAAGGAITVRLLRRSRERGSSRERSREPRDG